MRGPAEPRTPVEEQARAIVNEQVRDAYGAAFRVGALVTLLAIPFTLTMRRKPGDVHAARGRRAAGRPPLERSRRSRAAPFPYIRAHARSRRIRPRGLPAQEA